MISSQRSTRSSSTTNSTPTPSAAQNEDEHQEEIDEERDAFHIDDMPSPLSLPVASSSGTGVGTVHRPIPRVGAVGQHPRLQALQGGSAALNTSLPASSSTPSEHDSHSNKQGGMSRSISDSTLRRAALSLNLNQHSVLPSFTSLQQFKVYKYYKRHEVSGWYLRNRYIDTVYFENPNMSCGAACVTFCSKSACFQNLFFFDFCRKNCHYLTQHSGDLLQLLLGIENQ